MRLSAWLILAVVLTLLAACGGNEVRYASVDKDGKSGTAPQLTPQELAPALDALCQRVVQQVTAACERVDVLSPSNAVRRESLLWRIRATEAAANAQNNDNHIIGMIELWFWTASMNAFFGEDGAGAKAFGPGQAEARGCLGKIAFECEELVRRTVPPQGFAALRERVMTAAGKGEMFTATAAESRDMLKSLLDVTHIEGLLSIPLSPFTALKGIGTGSDAMANLVVVAQRAVNLADRYPQLMTWHAQLAVLGVEEQETVRGMREDLHRLIAIADEFPTRLREESGALLADPDLKDSLKQLESTATAMTKLAMATDSLMGRIQSMNKDKAGAASSPSRPFDIREYEATLRAAESTAREAQSVITAATGAIDKPQVIAAANAAAERLEKATDRLFLWSMVALAALGCIIAGLIMMHHSLDLKKQHKTRQFFREDR